ncbi:hypothetical protein HDU76_000909 [Blyttiomyces sp. JEL0837]|nr:hypothetical protein HDU76_000909 [Blyttiomyces sp. JEL0837]
MSILNLTSRRTATLGSAASKIGGRRWFTGNDFTVCKSFVLVETTGISFLCVGTAGMPPESSRTGLGKCPLRLGFSLSSHEYEYFDMLVVDIEFRGAALDIWCCLSLGYCAGGQGKFGALSAKVVGS